MPRRLGALAPVEQFVRSHLPPPPSRVLEVGCGAGELSLALAGAGYDVLAVDPEPPQGAIFRRSTIEELDEPGPFDGVLASRSLHHVSDLVVALERVAVLLRPGAAFVVDDFGWERLDPRSAERVGIPFDEWHAEHADLHTSEAMLRELDARLSRRSFSWEPYLHREAREVVSEATERDLIAAEEIQPIGFRYVGTR